MANGFLQFSAFRFQFSVLLKVKEARKFEPLLLLVDQVILLRAEAWEGCVCATWKWLTYIVATLGYNLENINLWSRIAQNISFHNAFEI